MTSTVAQGLSALHHFISDLQHHVHFTRQQNRISSLLLNFEFNCHPYIRRNGYDTSTDPITMPGRQRQGSIHEKLEPPYTFLPIALLRCYKSEIICSTHQLTVAGLILWVGGELPPKHPSSPPPKKGKREREKKENLGFYRPWLDFIECLLHMLAF